MTPPPSLRGDVRRRSARRGADPHAEHRRRWLVWTVSGVLLTVGLLVGAPWVYAEFVARDTLEPMTLTSPTATPEPRIPNGPVAIDGTWHVQEGSEAGYRLHETLSGREVTVVGRTEEVTGTVVVAGKELTEARVVVAAGTVATDEGARDAFFRRALDTSSHPDAVFELTEPVDVAQLADSAAPLTVTAEGILTLHGVSQPVVAELEAQRTADGVEVVGKVPVVLADYDLPVPDLGWVVVEPEGTIEIRLRLVR